MKKVLILVAGALLLDCSIARPFRWDAAQQKFLWDGSKDSGPCSGWVFSRLRSKKWDGEETILVF
jgi:hypothetical protein